MFIIEQYSTAIIFCFVTMLCWGSWANTQKLTAATWRFELFYWDYVLGIFLMSIVIALTLGSIGQGGRSFMQDFQQSDADNLQSAFTGGILFNLANILLVAAIDIAGMSVAFPVGIGLALVIGVIQNYVRQPLGNPYWLFGGVLLVVLAILLNAYAYQRMKKNQASVSSKGLILAVLAGILMGQFYGFVADSMFPDFNNPEPGKLSPYTAVVIFACGILISNILFNTLLMKYPYKGGPLSYPDYFNGSLKTHATGILGGVIWCVGMSFSIIASGKAGPAISYGLGQGATIIAAIWGIYIWKEFQDAPAPILVMLKLMLLLYGAGLLAIIYAR